MSNLKTVNSDLRKLILSSGGYYFLGDEDKKEYVEDIRECLRNGADPNGKISGRINYLQQLSRVIARNFAIEIGLILIENGFDLNSFRPSDKVEKEFVDSIRKNIQECKSK